MKAIGDLVLNDPSVLDVPGVSCEGFSLFFSSNSYDLLACLFDFNNALLVNAYMLMLLFFWPPFSPNS